MSRVAPVTKVAALSVLIFANFTGLFSQPPSIYRLPAGTQLKVKLDLELSSKVATKNDTFLTRLAQPVVVRDVVVVPEGTIVEGRVTESKGAAIGGQDGSLQLVFESIRFTNSTRAIDGVLLNTVTPGPSGTVNLLTILGGTATGAAIGAGSGAAAIGAVIGSGAGAGVAFLRKGKDVKLKKGEEIEIKLRKEVVLPVLDY